MSHVRCNAAAIPLLVFSFLLAIDAVGPSDDYASAVFLVVEAVAVKVTIRALAEKYRGL